MKQFNIRLSDTKKLMYKQLREIHISYIEKWCLNTKMGHWKNKTLNKEMSTK